MEGRKKGYDVGWRPPGGVLRFARPSLDGGITQSFFFIEFWQEEFWHNDDGLCHGFPQISFLGISVACNVFFEFKLGIRRHGCQFRWHA